MVDLSELNWQKCRKKPVEVEFCEVPAPMIINTLEGAMQATPGDDYLIRGVEGEYYPIKKEIFIKTYFIGCPEKPKCFGAKRSKKWCCSCIFCYDCSCLKKARPEDHGAV